MSWVAPIPAYHCWSGMAFLSKSLFSTYQFNPNTPTDQNSPISDQSSLSPFAISLPALSEALHVFGINENTKPNPWDRDYYNNDAFSAQVLGVPGICHIHYEGTGSPLVVVLKETGVTTTCELVTYEPLVMTDIPFSRDELELKAIMAATYLYEAIAEMSSWNPERICINATKSCLKLSAPGHHGSAVIRFHYGADTIQTEQDSLVTDDPVQNLPSQKGILETFLLSGSSFSQSYSFTHIAATRRALSSAIKVSLRGDSQGILSLQFMIENIDGQGVSFVDFRILPLVNDPERSSGEGSDISA
jgi:cell cycle checkpoint protein